jgi:hypothetical protein
MWYQRARAPVDYETDDVLADLAQALPKPYIRTQPKREHLLCPRTSQDHRAASLWLCPQMICQPHFGPRRGHQKKSVGIRRHPRR